MLGIRPGTAGRGAVEERRCQVGGSEVDVKINCISAPWSSSRSGWHHGTCVLEGNNFNMRITHRITVGAKYMAAQDGVGIPALDNLDVDSHPSAQWSPRLQGRLVGRLVGRLEGRDVGRLLRGQAGLQAPLRVGSWAGSFRWQARSRLQVRFEGRLVGSRLVKSFYAAPRYHVIIRIRSTSYVNYVGRAGRVGGRRKTGSEHTQSSARPRHF